MLAGDLKALNESRRDMTDRVVDEAMAKVEQTDIRGDKVLVIYLPDCHESLAGLVAGRVREKLLSSGICIDGFRRWSQRIGKINRKLFHV